MRSLESERGKLEFVVPLNILRCVWQRREMFGSHVDLLLCAHILVGISPLSSVHDVLVTV